MHLRAVAPLRRLLVSTCSGYLPVAVFDALVARFGFLQLVAHVLLEGMADSTRGACRCLDAILPEKGDRPPSHPAAEHHVSLLAVSQ